MRDKYPMPADAAGIGTASDPETGDVIAIGVVTRRRTYNKTGYICQKDAPAELHACACALLELVQDMPVIKTALLRPEDVCARLCGDETPAPSLLRRSALALAALRQALQGLPVHPRRRGVNRPRQTPGFICAPRPELTFGPHSWYRAD